MQIFSRSRGYPAIPILNSTLARLSHNTQHATRYYISNLLMYQLYLLYSSTLIATLISNGTETLCFTCLTSRIFFFIQSRGCFGISDHGTEMCVLLLLLR
jgi:hypothetical protein